MSMHERSPSELFCFQFPLPWPSTLLDPFAFVITKMIIWGWVHIKALLLFYSSPRAREAHTGCGVSHRQCGSECQVQIQERDLSGREGICLFPYTLKGVGWESSIWRLVIYTSVERLPNVATAEGAHCSFKPSWTQKYHLSMNGQLESRGVTTHLDIKFFFLWYQFEGRELSDHSYPS